MDNTIEIIRGTSKVLAVNISDINGTEYTLQSGERLLLGVKKQLDDKEYTIIKAVTDKTDGEYSFKLMPSDTADLPSGNYYYDVGLESGLDFINVIPPSDFIILPNVVRHGASV